MKRILVWMCTVVLVLSGCTEEESPKYKNNGLETITANIEQNTSNSRVLITDDNGGATLSWIEGDAFKTFGDEDAVYNYNEETSEFKVEDKAPERIDYAVYPNTDSYNPTMNNKQLTITLPASFENVEQQCKIPMWAGAPVNGHLTFKHLVALLKIDLTGIKNYATVEVEADKPIAGFFIADLSKDAPTLVSSDQQNGNTSVSISLKDVSDDAEVIYLPIPATTYESLKVTAKKEENEGKELKSWTNLTFERAKMYTATIVNLSTPEGVNEVLEDLTTTPVILNLPEGFTASAGEESSATAITIPNVPGSDLTLSFGAAPTTTADEPLVIESKDETTVGESTKSLTISIPASSDDDTEIYLEVNTPTTTATVASGNYASLTATTATNTLIINGGVTIGKLTINGGNVLIEAGVVINEIVNNVNASIDYIVRTENSLKAAFENGGEYKVYEDIVISDVNGVKVGANTSVVLNLNDKMITADGNAFVVESGGTLTLNDNGLVKAGNTVGSWIAVWADGGQVTIYGGNYSVGLDSDDSNSCIYVQNGGEVTINAGEFSHEIPTSGNNNGMPLQAHNDTEGKIIVNNGVFVLDNDCYYEQQDLDAGKIEINGTETRDNDKMIVSDATGATVVIENKGLSQALYKLFEGTYYIKLNDEGFAEMLDSEVNSITEIKILPQVSQGIADFTSLVGVEKFENLEELRCHNVLLTECDLSQNEKLTKIIFQGTRLTTLDLSYHPSLKSLSLSDEDDLTSLNLNGCDNLEYLGLGNSNKLTSLILNGCINLNSFHVTGCDLLTSVDMPDEAKNRLLALSLINNQLNFNLGQFPNLIDLRLSYKKLTDLDVIPSGIKQRLQYLDVIGNQLESLDLSEFPDLKTLDCSENQITNLNLSNCPNLVRLGCLENQITELNLSGCPKLSWLVCEYNKIEALDITPCEGLNTVGCGNQQDNIQITLTLTENQKTILVDNGQLDLENNRITLNVVK